MGGMKSAHQGELHAPPGQYSVMALAPYLRRAAPLYASAASSAVSNLPQVQLQALGADSNQYEPR